MKKIFTNSLLAFAACISFTYCMASDAVCSSKQGSAIVINVIEAGKIKAQFSFSDEDIDRINVVAGSLFGTAVGGIQFRIEAVLNSERWDEWERFTQKNMRSKYNVLLNNEVTNSDWMVQIINDGRVCIKGFFVDRQKAVDFAREIKDNIKHIYVAEKERSDSAKKQLKLFVTLFLINTKFRHILFVVIALCLIIFLIRLLVDIRR